MPTKAFPDGFSCESGPCDEAELFVVVTDEDGQASPFASVLVTFTETP